MAMQRVEQARAAKWDPAGFPPRGRPDKQTGSRRHLGYPDLRNKYCLRHKHNHHRDHFDQSAPEKNSRGDRLALCEPGNLHERSRHLPRSGPMRISVAHLNCRKTAAFTFTELMVATTLLMMVLAGLLAAHLFGMRMVEITKAKLGANDEARQAISLMMQEIRSGKLVKIGSGNLTNFTEVPVDTPQQGSAVEIYPAASTNQYVRYFWDEDSQKLKRTTNGATSVSIVAELHHQQHRFCSRGLGRKRADKQQEQPRHRADASVLPDSISHRQNWSRRVLRLLSASD